ncbi:MAG: hypothetical protein V7638_4825 [Acidobacteriota bacterium]|jgi:hypothetical protein
MPIIGTSRFNERIKFFNGQRLFASDLQDVEQFNREMRWLHNQSLHQAGVASGYAVTGNKDDREVTIEAGYAIDSLGREIVLTQPEVLQIPPVANDGQGNPVYYDLTVSYPSDLLLKETETRDGVCVSRSAVRLREKPVFCWIELVSTSTLFGAQAITEGRQAKLATLNKQVEDGLRIRLARAEILNCKLNQPLSVAQRRNAKPPPQPFIFANRTDKNLQWSPRAKDFAIEVTARVDTSAAHFRTPPRYFANVIGPREVKVKPVLGSDNEVTLIIDGFERIYSLSDELSPGFQNTDTDDRVGFKFSLFIPSILMDLRTLTLEQVAAALNPALKDWYVEWMGVEE